MRRSQRQGIYGLALSPDHRTLAAVGQDGTTRFWNLATFQETMRWIERIPLWRVWFAPDGNTLVGSTRNQIVLVRAPSRTDGRGADGVLPEQELLLQIEVAEEPRLIVQEPKRALE